MFSGLSRNTPLFIEYCLNNGSAFRPIMWRFVLLAEPDEARQLSRLHTLHSQQSLVRHTEHHIKANCDVGDEVLLWTPVRKPGSSEKLLKTFTGPFVVHRQNPVRNYEVTSVIPPRDHHSGATDIVHFARMNRTSDLQASP